MKRRCSIWLIRVSLALLLFVSLSAAFPTTALAMDEPDSVSLHDIVVYQNLITSGDMFFIVPYSIPFTTIPDDRINETFLFRMFSANLTEVGAYMPYPYHDLGYGSGILQFYLPSGGIEDEPYIFRVQQSPVFYVSPQTWDFAIGPANYSQAADQSAALKAKLIEVATDLSLEYNVELLTTDEGVVTLSTYGEIYFLNAAPGLNTMCPEMFSMRMRTPDYTRRSWDSTVATTLETRFPQGTPVGEFMIGTAGLFSTDTSTTMNILSVILFAVVFFTSVKWFRASTYSALLDGYAILLLLMLNGFFSMIGAGFVAFIAAMVGGVYLFLNRA